MLWIGRDVAWLKLGSCTDHVTSAAAAPPANVSKPRPASSRRRRTSASRIAAGDWLTEGMTGSTSGILISPEFDPAGAAPRSLFHCMRQAQAESSLRRDYCRLVAASL